MAMNTQSAFKADLTKVLTEIENILADKNRRYGDAALNPLRIFAKSDSIEQINVRIDDKINRLMSLQKDDTEDAELDLLGYLVIKRIALLRSKRDAARAEYLMVKNIADMENPVVAETLDEFETAWVSMIPVIVFKDRLFLRKSEKSHICTRLSLSYNSAHNSYEIAKINTAKFAQEYTDKLLSLNETLNFLRRADAGESFKFSLSTSEAEITQFTSDLRPMWAHAEA